MPVRRALPIRQGRWPFRLVCEAARRRVIKDAYPRQVNAHAIAEAHGAHSLPERTSPASAAKYFTRDRCARLYPPPSAASLSLRFLFVSRSHFVNGDLCGESCTTGHTFYTL